MVKRSDYNWDRQQVENLVEELSLYDLFDCSADETIDQIVALKSKYSGKIRFTVESWDDYYTIAVRESRLETDDEYEDRLECQENVLKKWGWGKSQKTKEDRERAEYERLKKKFGNK
jgi:hypothetical protein